MFAASDNGVCYDDTHKLYSIPKDCKWDITNEMQWVGAQINQIPGPFDLIFLHDTNHSHLDAISARVQTDRTIVVHYHADPPPRKVLGEEFWIRKRPLHSENDRLTELEINELLNWVREGGPRDQLPSLLMPYREHEQDCNRAALAILCQGYLAMMAVAASGEPSEAGLDDIELVTEALKLMGWKGSPQSEIADAERKAQSARSKAWWKVVFPVLPPDFAAFFGKSFPPEAQALVRSIFDGGANVVHAGLVARAYLALRNM